MMHREDAYCPACPDPDTAFRLEDVGREVVREGNSRRDNALTVKFSRPAWEAVMLEHLRLTDDEPHQRLYDRCVTELMAAGKTAADAARDEVEAVAAVHRRWLDDVVRGGL